MGVTNTSKTLLTGQKTVPVLAICLPENALPQYV